MDTDASQPSRTGELEDFFRRYGDMPREVIVKEDILRWGVRFSEAALAVGSEYRARSYFIFSYDRTNLDEMDKGEAVKAPDEIKIEGGPWDLRTTLISTRIHYRSPWEIDVEDGQLVLRGDGRILARVSYPEKPWYYGMAFDDGQLYAELVPVVGWNARMFCTVQRACGFWGDEEECHFCDINANLRALRRQGRNYTPRKDPARVAAVIKNMLDKRPPDEPEIDCIILSGGTNLDRTNNEIIDKEFYVDVVRAVSDAVDGRAPIMLQTVAREKDILQSYKDAGVTSHHANIEVWDKNLFQIMSPGKDQWIGRDEWIRRTVDSVDIFGPGNITPGLVAGVEMARPHGFTDWPDAVASTTEGLDYLMARGVVPRVPQWCIEPLSGLAGQNEDLIVPLEYFVNICRNWFEIWCKYGLPKVCGYPLMGPGQSLYQNGAFLDME